MAEKINWNFVAQVLKGPSISGADSLEVDAYEKFDFTIAKDGTNTVALQDASKISLLIISSATYPKISLQHPQPKIIYKGGTGTTAKKLPGEPDSGYVLDAPHIFIGQIAKDFFKDSTDITFTNSTGAEVEIQILIGRTIA